MKLWKIATRLIHYYDTESADATKLDQEIIIWANEITDNLEEVLNVTSVIKGPLEPKLPGEDK